ncbi:MAG TPA: ADOP family duplicated permease [Gemmatimonadaceae bacterium]|nr:ADOP family duplicated permease [Gemmatimonadaceae bacterium]
MRWIRRIFYWTRFRSEQSNLRDELALHRDMLRDEYIRRGLARGDAADAANRTMGNATLMREDSRGVWLPARLDAAIGDWRYAARGLRRSPAFTTIAVLSLALGIGANTAIFGVIHSLLLARLPVPAARALVQLQRTGRAKDIDSRFSRAELGALLAGPLRLAMFSTTFASFDAGGVSGNVSIQAVDSRYFALLGLRAARGRLIGPGDDDAPIAVATDRFWRTRLNSDAGAIGRTLTIDGARFILVGIAPPGYAGLGIPAVNDVTIPYHAATTLGIVREPDSRAPIVAIIGRREETQSLGALGRGMNDLWRRCCADGNLVAAAKGQQPPTSTLGVIDISRGIPQPKLNLRGRYRGILFALMAGVAVLLLAGCANVANLLLGRNRARATELAVRLALGASARRLVGQLIIESVQLALLGAVAGLLLAWWATAALARANVGDLSGIVSTNPNAAVLAFTGAISVLCVMACGLVPALGALRTDLVSSLRQDGVRASRSGRGILDGALVAAQVALALLLVSGAALLVQTLRNLQDTALGFEPERLALTVETRHTAYARGGMTVALATEMLRRVTALPSVRDAAFASYVPVYGGRGAFDEVTVRGSTARGDDDATTSFVGVTPGYFAALGIPILAGRDLGPLAPGPLPRARDVVVNRRFAKKFFPGRDPIGRVFRDADPGDTSATEDRIVGLVADARFDGVRAEPRPMYFVSILDGDWPFLILVARPSGAPVAAGDAIAHAIAGAAPGIGTGEPTLVSASIAEALSRERISARLASLFGVVALCLVAVGLYGVLSYRVTERIREIGIRMALGADGASVVGLVLRQSLRLIGLGLVVGLPLALLAGRAVSSQLYGVAPYDVVVLATATTLVLATAMVACIVPVRRALGTDPLVALRAN